MCLVHRPAGDAVALQRCLLHVSFPPFRHRTDSARCLFSSCFGTAETQSKLSLAEQELFGYYGCVWLTGERLRQPGQLLIKKSE